MPHNKGWSLNIHDDELEDPYSSRFDSSSERPPLSSRLNDLQRHNPPHQPSAALNSRSRLLQFQSGTRRRAVGGKREREEEGSVAATLLHASQESLHPRQSTAVPAAHTKSVSRAMQHPQTRDRLANPPPSPSRMTLGAEAGAGECCAGYARPGVPSSVCLQRPFPTGSPSSAAATSSASFQPSRVRRSFAPVSHALTTAPHRPFDDLRASQALSVASPTTSDPWSSSYSSHFSPGHFGDRTQRGQKPFAPHRHPQQPLHTREINSATRRVPLTPSSPPQPSIDTRITPPTPLQPPPSHLSPGDPNPAWLEEALFGPAFNSKHPAGMPASPSLALGEGEGEGTVEMDWERFGDAYGVVDRVGQGARAVEGWREDEEQEEHMRAKVKLVDEGLCRRLRVLMHGGA